VYGEARQRVETIQELVTSKEREHLRVSVLVPTLAFEPTLGTESVNLIGLLTESLRSSVEQESTTALLYFEIENSRDFIECGRALRKRLLKEIETRLKSMLRSNRGRMDIALHLLDNEFVVVCNSIQRGSDTDAISARLLHGMRRPIMIAGQVFHLEADLGVAASSRFIEPALLIHQAKSALHQAQISGVRQAHFVEREVTPEVQNRAQLV
jgi:GGDEF domain-containing protein